MGEIDNDGRSPADRALQNDLAAMRLDDPSADGKPQAGSLRLGGKEGFERAALDFGTHALAAIGDDQSDSIGQMRDVDADSPAIV